MLRQITGLLFAEDTGWEWSKYLMSNLSNLGAINNKIENNDMLKFARNIMSEEQFIKIYKSYRRLFWTQLSVPIAGVVFIPLLCLAFSEYAMIIAAFGTVLFLFLFIVNLILSQFLVGRLWHKYVKLYKSGCHPNVILYDLFG